MHTLTATLKARHTTVQIVAGLLLTLLPGFFPVKHLFADESESVTAVTVASEVEHTIWTTPGELVNFRVTPELLYASAAGDEQQWVATMKGRPNAAELLNNPDGSQSLLWVPVAADIGTWPLEIDVLSIGDSVERRTIRMQIEVLEGQVKLARLNALPDLLITDSSDLAVQNEAMVRAALLEPLNFRVIAKDIDSESPLVSLVGDAVNLIGVDKRVDGDSSTTTTDKVDAAPEGSLKADSVVVEGETHNNGYQNFTVYAVDRKHPLQYVSQTVNVLVEEARPQGQRTSWTEIEDTPQINNYPGYRRGPISSAAVADD